MMGHMTASPADQFDALTVEQLRARGSLKWTAHPDALGAFVAEMDFGMAPVIREALDDMNARALYGYTPPALAREMAEACADYNLRAYNWAVDPDLVLPIPEVLAAFHQIITCYMRPGTKIIVPTPCYMPFVTIPAAHGREVIEVPMLNDGASWQMDLDALDQAFRDGGELLLICNPHNPIGKVYTPEELAAIAEIVDRHGGRVFNDEIHAPLTYEGQQHTSYASISDAAAAHTITAASASKSWNLAGLKCAQVIFTNPDDKATWDARAARLAGEAATPGIIANTAAYRDGLPWLREVIDYIDGNRALATELLAAEAPQLKVIRPQGTYLLWVDCRATGRGDICDHFLTEAKVALTDGALCGHAGEGFVRINLATARPIVRQLTQAMIGAL